MTTSNDLGASPLGRAATYAERYDPDLLFAVERAPQRALLELGTDLPFRGADVWNAYEASWLDAQGKPEIAIVTFVVPADSPRLVESKSVKLYLASFNQERVASAAEARATIARDLSNATGAAVAVTLTLPQDFAKLRHAEPAGECIDALTLSGVHDALAPESLSSAGPVVSEALHSQLFRSVCPVTGQPDYASVELAYRGTRIDRAGLLAYLVSFRRHPGFHEHCVELIFTDVWRRCRPEALSVHARFTRRGGIDINPYRTSGDEPPPSNARTARQ
ncbi:MAG TPA: NADPH-dependent 7-cyano-7-deazaguanine reductase QueF [Casimicrobiaceae bacterium]|nr:NADPH-dependent 7-cyano-7-deazaguanine reductase QueF [Casimicrobiaceae bacterium]